MNNRDFSARAQTALKDDRLRAATAHTTDKLRNARTEAAERLPGSWEDWRRRGEAIRSATLARLDQHLEHFISEFEARGGHVHAAKTGEEAVRAVLKIIRKSGGRRIVKSKSMLAEEVGLNDALKKAGHEVTETDLGERIIQLAGERPSHIIIPSIHKNREEIGRLFSEEAGHVLATDTQTLASHARSTLRSAFLEADIGITGVNFAVAETGSLTLFTNEGNGRMVTTLPRVSIALMGIERIVPTWDDFAVMATLLPRSATGQNLTVYLSVSQGPGLSPDDDGPEEAHVILVDNGRSDQLADPEFRSILRCIRCGACLNVCPVYRQVGGHAYGSVYPGPIGAVLTPLIDDAQSDSTTRRDLPWASSLCGACAEVCPVRIPLDNLLVSLRRRQIEAGSSRVERSALKAWAAGFVRPKQLKRGIGLARTVQSLLGPRFSLLPGVRRWAIGRNIPTLAPKTFVEAFDRERQRKNGSR